LSIAEELKLKKERDVKQKSELNF